MRIRRKTTEILPVNLGSVVMKNWLAWDLPNKTSPCQISYFVWLRFRTSIIIVILRRIRFLPLQSRTWRYRNNFLMANLEGLVTHIAPPPVCVWGPLRHDALHGWDQRMRTNTRSTGRPRCRKTIVTIENPMRQPGIKVRLNIFMAYRKFRILLPSYM